MQITVFGANGKVGNLVVDLALKNDYKVVAFSHGATSRKPHQNLQIIRGDVQNIKEVDIAIKNSDVVISALGSWRTPSKDILTVGMQNIVPSMIKYKVKRIISLTGSGANMEGDQDSIINKLSHFFIKLGAKKILLDGENHIKFLQSSGLDWTVLRSPIMNGLGETNNYKLTDKKSMPWSTINRVSVANALIQQIVDNNYIHQAPHIRRNNK